MKKFLSFFAFALLVAACSSDDDNGGTPPPPQDPEATIIYVANEGSFGQGTASLTAYNATEGVVFQNVFALVNGEPLGDTFQSMYLRNGELFMVVNNSEKIEVCDPLSMERKRTIEIANSSPRYMHFIGESKAYVTDFSANGIHVVNMAEATYSGFISTGTWTEHMLEVNGEVWTSNPGGTELHIIDPTSDAVLGEIELTDGPNTLVRDTQGDVWVMCNGTFNNDDSFAALHRVDPVTKTIEASFALGATDDYSATVRVSPDGQHLLFIRGGDVYKMDITATELPTSPFIAGGNRNFYGFHINPSTGEIALTDAGDFQSNGQVYLYDVDGNETFAFEAGVIPGFVTWSE